MKIIKPVSQQEVFEHWVIVENLNSISDRDDIITPLLQYQVSWYAAVIEKQDLDKIFNISSDDWRVDGLCTPNFKLATAAMNVDPNKINIDPDSAEKHQNILEKESLFSNQPGFLDTRLFLVAPNIAGPFTLIEGNKRAVALCRLEQLEQKEVYLGLSASFINYKWATQSRL